MNVVWIGRAQWELPPCEVRYVSVMTPEKIVTRVFDTPYPYSTGRLALNDSQLPTSPVTNQWRKTETGPPSLSYHHTCVRARTHTHIHLHLHIYNRQDNFIQVITQQYNVLMCYVLGAARKGPQGWHQWNSETRQENDRWSKSWRQPVSYTHLTLPTRRWV